MDALGLWGYQNQEMDWRILLSACTRRNQQLGALTGLQFSFCKLYRKSRSPQAMTSPVEKAMRKPLKEKAERFQTHHSR